MSRINVIPVKMLLPHHKKGEFHEITRVFTLVKNAVEKGKTPDDYDIPKSYKLNKGHVTFFYTKLRYIADRYIELAYELERDGVNINFDLVDKILKDAAEHIPRCWWGNYEPSNLDIYLNMARLCKMSKEPTVLQELQHV